MSEPPLRVWLYRGWCWICNRCHPTPGSSDAYRQEKVHVGVGSGHGYATQQEALGAALAHCDRTPEDWER